ncbi:MAG: hypothetical protein J0H18_10795 [Rhizobiales bacterium]|nr:hypothetical protein [Hyphomicrobiales bacterium]OJY03794.1 MAG: hypothetical protein BGP07_07935 [Rhizobiales bacterium 63-22]
MSDNTDRLDELLRDPVILQVMASDNVRPHDVRTLFEKARDRAERAAIPAPHIIRPCHSSPTSFHDRKATP